MRHQVLLLLLLLQGHAELVPFDPFSPQPKMSYKDGYQKRYFVLDSFQVG
jgi:phenylalanine-4-hydroxylase